MIRWEKSTDYIKFYMDYTVCNTFGLLWKETLSVFGGQSLTNVWIFFKYL